MAWLQGLLRPARDGISSDDEIYPLHLLDHTPVCESIMTWTMRFNDVLDPHKLHTSLGGLLEIGHWRKLGGRLRKHGSRYRLHVPPTFTKERPALTFTTETFDMPLAEHPLGCQMPQPADRPMIQANTELFQSLHLPANAPTSFDEYLSQGLPPISLHVVTFSDATLVTIAWPHVITDAKGLQGLMKAWTLSLHGRIDEIPELRSARRDVADEVTDPANNLNEPSEECRIASQSLSMFGTVLFVLRMLWDIFLGPKVEPRMMFLPKSAVEKLQRQAEDEIGSLDVEHEAHEGKGEVSGRVSKGDILASWIARIIASALPTPRPITVISAVDIRFRVPVLRDVEETSSVLVQNLLLAAFTQLSPSKGLNSSLGEIAAANRRNLVRQLTVPQLVAFLRVMQRSKDSWMGGAVIIGQPDSLLVSISNWTSNQFCRVVDFSPAVLRVGDTSSARKNPPGTILYHYPGMVKRTRLLRNMVCILGTDHEENYWFSVFLDSRTLSKVDASMKELSKQ